MSRILKAALLLGVVLGLYQVAVMANGSPMPDPSGSAAPSPSSSTPGMTPEQQAIQAYNSGIEHRDKGQKLDLKAATEQGQSRQRSELQAFGEYEKALNDFRKAAGFAPRMYQAYNGMGYAYRKTRDYAKALEMYDKALELQPGFPEALEYRGEAYLGMNQVEDAKKAYLQLFASDRKQADILMEAMNAWVTAQKAKPTGVDAATVSAFEAWIKERATLAQQTVQMALVLPQSSWR
jgi:tetratricopeptide (TPR) repeat protein